jgi:predicted transposase/invertase (TIGR01784 family)
MSKKRPFTHSFVFPSVIIDDPSILKDIIQLFFPDIAIGRIEPEQTLAEYIILMKDKKSTRLDLRMKDDEGNIIVAEMLRYEDSGIEIRIQRYTAAEIVNQIKRGVKKEELQQIFTLLICSEPFNGSYHAVSRYSLSENKSEKKLESSPEILVLFYNGDEEGLNKKQKAFLKYLREGKLHRNSSALVRRVHSAVNKINEDQYWREALMTIEEWMEFESKEAAKEAAEKAAKKAAEKAAKKARAEHCRDLLKRQMSAGLTFEEAAERLMLTKKEIQEVLDSGFADMKS